ncbi:endonuclease/exonuclease/phosphatase family protein, partial [Aeromicrobium sp.]|uniref:endonuclease/exonuclease/phosphatase family protein n=1 Tax=Aeromicrobium sp. TaxID=1871063 RepID=UPI001986497D
MTSLHARAGLTLLASGLIFAIVPGVSAAQAAELSAPNPSMTQISVNRAYATWPAVVNADEYALRVTKDGVVTHSSTSTSLTRTISLPTTTPGTRYQYTVTAIDNLDEPISDGEGGQTHQVRSTSSAKTLIVRADMTKIRFATYNVCAEHCPKLRSWSYRVSRVTAVIKSKNPDVVTLQETGGYTRLTSLTSRMKSSGYTRARGGSSRWIFYRTATMSARDYKGAALYGKTVHV